MRTIVLSVFVAAAASMFAVPAFATEKVENKDTRSEGTSNGTDGESLDSADSTCADVCAGEEEVGQARECIEACTGSVLTGAGLGAMGGASLGIGLGTIFPGLGNTVGGVLGGLVGAGLGGLHSAYNCPPAPTPCPECPDPVSYVGDGPGAGGWLPPESSEPNICPPGPPNYSSDPGVCSGDGGGFGGD